MVIAACADASLRAWEMVNKTFKEAANGEKKGKSSPLNHPQMGLVGLGLPTIYLIWIHMAFIRMLLL